MALRRTAFAAGFFALGLFQVVFAADPPNPIGFPKKVGGGGEGVVRVWYEDGTWHLRTSTEDSQAKKDKLIVFTGTVVCDGKMTIEEKKLEKGKGKTSDTLTRHKDDKGFDFRFATHGATDEAAFKVEGAKAKTLKFTINIDGEKAAVGRIYIGADGEHPDKHEFTLPAVPPAKK
jgi:hypothetical protein